MSFLEAGSYGIPIVTTPVGGLVDIIESEKNCMVFDYGNHKVLAEQLCRLIENKALQDEISKNITLIIKEKFSISAIDMEIQKLYQNL